MPENLHIFSNIILWVTVLTFRVLAGTMSAIALVVLFRQWKTHEHPPYDRRRNDIAWAWAHAGMIIGTISFGIFDFRFGQTGGQPVHPTGYQTIADLSVAIIWWCLANAACVRMAAKWHRPEMVYRAATIFILGGMIIASVKAFWG